MNNRVMGNTGDWMGNTIKWLLLLSIPFTMTIGQILFKYTAIKLVTDTRLVAFLFNPFFLSAVVIYGITTVAWVSVLKYVELTRAYPIMAIAYILVPVASWLLFKETLTLKYIAGIVLIISGIILTQSA